MKDQGEPVRRWSFQVRCALHPNLSKFGCSGDSKFFHYTKAMSSQRKVNLMVFLFRRSKQQKCGLLCSVVVRNTHITTLAWCTKWLRHIEGKLVMAPSSLTSSSPNYSRRPFMLLLIVPKTACGKMSSVRPRQCRYYNWRCHVLSISFRTGYFLESKEHRKQEEKLVRAGPGAAKEQMATACSKSRYFGWRKRNWPQFSPYPKPSGSRD